MEGWEGSDMGILQLKRELKDLKGALKPEHPASLVIFLYEDEKIVEIQGQDVTRCTLDEINEMLDSVSIHYYLPKPKPEDLE